MKLYRICTENKNYPAILDYLDENFPDGYTVIHANGAWQGKREKSLLIEITGNETTRFTTVRIPPMSEYIAHLCYWLKKHNDQQAVLVQIIEIGQWIQ